MKKVHRLVVLPDYQGIGVGGTLLRYVGSLYKKEGFRFNIMTSHPALIWSLKKDKNWALRRKGRASGGNKTSDLAINKTNSQTRITTSWELK